MIYQTTITLDPNISKDNSIKRDLLVTKGLVYFVEVFIPPGVCGLAGTRIMDGSYQVWPSTPNEWFTGDDLLLSYQDLYLKEEEPYCFQVESYNEDEAYSHSLIIRIALVSKKAYQARFLPSIELSMHQELWDKILKEQEEERRKRYEDIFGSPFPTERKETE